MANLRDLLLLEIALAFRTCDGGQAASEKAAVAAVMECLRAEGLIPKEDS